MDDPTDSEFDPTSDEDPIDEGLELLEFSDESREGDSIDSPQALASQDADSVPEEDFNEFEFSLEKLSTAYAQVLEQRSQPTSEANDIEAEPGAVAIDLDPDDEQRDNAPCPLNETTVLESLLFVGTPADQRFTAKKLASLLRDVSPKEVKQIVEQLNRGYAEQGSALRIVTEDGGLRLDLAPEMQVWKNKFLGEIRETELTQHAIDVLAIIAYNQPVSKKQIDNIRQRPSGSIVNQLLQRQLIDVDPQTSDHKSPSYITTPRFLSLFGMEHLDDLPHVQEVESIDDFFD